MFVRFFFTRKLENSYGFIKKANLSITLSISLSLSFPAYAEIHASLVKTLSTGDKKGTEIISIQAKNKLFAVSNSKKGVIDIYSIKIANAPTLIRRIDLNLPKGQHITSVAVHPQFNYLLATIQAADPMKNGHIEVRDINSGQLLNTVKSGVGPDAVVIDPTGQFAIIPNEAEEFVLNRKKLNYHSADGSISLVQLTKNPQNITATLIELPNLTGLNNAVNAKDKRFIERGIDWNNDGEITEDPLDLNGNGK